MNSSYPFAISVPSGPQHPAINVNVGRVTVILGANGAGKSALLRAMHSHNVAPAYGLRQTRKVDARRIMQVIGNSSLRRAEIGESVEQIANSILEEYQPDPRQLQTASAKLLEALCHRDRLRDTLYAAECDRLARSGQQASIREKPASPLDEFREVFRSVLPDVDLCFDTSSVTLKVSKLGASTYGPETMSSGEQQVFLLLGKFIFGHPKTVFLIDEPELNLNPRLAEKFWSAIERRHPECAFVYATHALHFALRPEVSRALVLTRDGAIPLDASDEFFELAREDREQFLGSIPSVVLASKILFTEGGGSSIDRPLYEYLLQDSTIKVEPVGSCEEVEKAVAGRQGWEKFTRDARVAGVIDSDYKHAAELARLGRLDVLTLPVHEAESVLCLPEAVEALSVKMHPGPQQVSAATVLDAIAARLRAQRIQVALRRAAEILRAPFAPSLSSAAAKSISSDEEAVCAFAQAGEQHLEFLKQKNLGAVVRDELARLDAVLVKHDASEMLLFLPGKSITRQICFLLRIQGGAAELLAYYQKHFPDAAIPAFLTLQRKLRGLFSTSQVTAASVDVRAANSGMTTAAAG